MEIKNFTITKRDGSKDLFSLDKIMNAIVKAFESVGVPADLGTISKILSRLEMHDDIKVEEIQNQVEEALMKEGHYQVAKSFMLYRQAHSEDRETLAKLQFLSDYCESVNAAAFQSSALPTAYWLVVGDAPDQPFVGPSSNEGLTMNVLTSTGLASLALAPPSELRTAEL